jgi:beta-aspartyl-peptidase (threonine type)
LNAAQAAVRVLEDAPTLNAGIGSVLTRAGTVECDAAVMEGTTLRAGAVAAMEFAYPAIDIARAVLEDGEHILYCGDGAWAFAREHGFEPSDAQTMITQLARRRLTTEAKRRAAGKEPLADPGTVGACAVDGNGHVAAATSTGGTTFKRQGRIGDTPLIGCGTYADDRGGAASATGQGEAIIRVTMTRQCSDHMMRGATASEAAWLAVDDLDAMTGADSGIICCDHNGRFGAAHNAPRMSWAGGAVGGNITAGVEIEHGTDVFAGLGLVG